MTSLDDHVSEFQLEADMFSVFPYNGLAKKKKTTIIFDIKFHDSYLMKCLHNNITQIYTIWWHMYLLHLVSNGKTTSYQSYN